MSGVDSIAISVRTIILTSYKNTSRASWGPLFVKKIIIHTRKKSSIKMM